MADSNNVDTDLDEKIIHQVEYYFGDFNFPKDKFIQEQIKLDDGWIPLSTMLNFKRLAALTTDQDRIISALKKSTANLIEIDDGQKKIRRSVENPAPLLTESRQKEIQSRTVYCKGFSKENASLDKLLEYFKQFGSVENVQMRTYLDKASKEYIFKGSVFVVFSTKDIADEFVQKEGLEYENNPLIIKTQEDYIAYKRKEREDKKKMQREKLHRVTGKQPKDNKDEDNESEEEDESRGFVKGAVLRLKGIPSSTSWEEIRNAVQRTWKAGAKEGEDEEVEVAYVDYQNGDEEAWVRLAEAGAASLLAERARHALAIKEKSKGDGEEAKEVKIKEEKEEKKEMESEEENKEKEMEKEEKRKMESEIKKEMNGDDEGSSMEVNGVKVEIHVLKDEEERVYLEKAKGAREKKFLHGRSFNRGGRRGGRGKGRGFRGGKRKNTWDSGLSSKKVRQ